MDRNSQARNVNVAPYPGLASFGDSAADRELFFGRDKESQTLLEMVLAENLVLLFARSGVGKTSMINAGVLEPLRTRGFFPVVVRLTHDPNRGPIQSVYECVAEQATRDHVIVSDESSTKSLWEYFYTTQFAKNGKLLRPVLILDQFEELFTIMGPQKSRRESFVRELADLARQRVPEQVRKRETGKLETLHETDTSDPERQRIVSLLYEGAGPEVKTLISIREDFLAEIEGLKSELPTIFRNSFRLEPLSIDEARKAIEEPTQQKELLGDNRFTFAPGVVDRMLDFLRIQKVGGKFVRANSIEPVQLQILCQHFYRQSLRKRQPQQGGTGAAQVTEGAIPEITLTDLGGRNGMKRAMVGYYHRVLKQFPRFRLGWSTRGYRPSLCNFLIINRARAAIRTLAENKLVTPGGYRNSISVDVIERGVGVPDHDLTELVDERLLRTEPRLGSHFYELTHDTLLRPLLKARRRRRRYWAAAIFIPLLLLLYLPGFAVLHRSLELRSYYLELGSRKRNVSNQNLSPEERIANFKLLVNAPRFRDCSKCDLTTRPGTPQIDLHSFRAFGIGLSEAHLDGANFKDAIIAYSDFTKATLTKADFTNANLFSSDLTGAVLTQAKLNNAKLGNTDFTNATLTDAKLAGASVDGADFTNATIDPAAFQAKDDKGEITLETVWWTAIWSSEKLKELKEALPNKSIKDSATFQKELKNYTENAEGWAAPVDLNTFSSLDEESRMDYQKQAAEAYNLLAWYLAVRGVDLDKAETDARKARLYEPTADRLMDTLGFILLQVGKYDEALPLLQQSLTSRQQAASDPARIGLAHYHLALVLDRKGDKAQAQVHFDQAKQSGYRPTFECLVAPPSDMTGCDWPNPRKSMR